mgnify:CR=1 FL=1
MSQKFSEAVGILAVIDPDAYSTGAQTAGWVDMADWAQAVAVVLVGDVTASGGVDALVNQATNSTGAGSKAITAKTMTTLTTAGSNKQVIININEHDLDVDNDFRYIQLSVTLSSAGADMAGAILGILPKYGVATDNDNSSVTEVVA